MGLVQVATCLGTSMGAVLQVRTGAWAVGIGGGRQSGRVGLEVASSLRPQGKSTFLWM